MHFRKLMVASLVLIGVGLISSAPAFAQVQITASGALWGANVSGIHFSSSRVVGHPTLVWVGAWNGSSWDFGKWLSPNPDGDFDNATGLYH